MKRITPRTAALIASIAILAVPALAFAQSATFAPLTQLPGLSTLTGTSPTVPAFINNLYRIAIGLAAFAAIVQLIWAGFIFMGSADSVAKNSKARAKIVNAVLGLIIVLSPYVVFSIINPAILNLNLNFGALQSAPATGASAAGTDTTVTPASCTATGFSGIKAVATSPGCSSLGSGYTNLAAGCCAGMASGNVCCGNPTGSNI